MSTINAAAILFSLVTAGVAAFQLALALGAPWGSYAMGGAFPGSFPPAMRGAAVVQALVILLIAAIVLARAGLGMATWKPASMRAIWIVVAFSGVGLVLNAISPSAGERGVWVHDFGTIKSGAEPEVPAAADWPAVRVGHVHFASHSSARMPYTYSSAHRPLNHRLWRR